MKYLKLYEDSIPINTLLKDLRGLDLAESRVKIKVFRRYMGKMYSNPNNKDYHMYSYIFYGLDDTSGEITIDDIKSVIKEDKFKVELNNRFVYRAKFNPTEFKKNKEVYMHALQKTRIKNISDLISIITESMSIATKIEFIVDNKVKEISINNNWEKGNYYKPA